MVKHIVMWRFKKDCQEQAQEFLNGMRGLYGKIPQIQSLEIGINVNQTNDFDAVLVSEFASMDDFEIFKKDPRHVAIGKIGVQCREAKGAVDFIC